MLFREWILGSQQILGDKMKMIKIITILCLSAFVLQAQDITNKLGGISAGDTYDVTDSADKVLFRVKGDGNVGIGTTNPDATLDVHGTVKLFGSYETKTNGPHQALTDGFVVCFILGSSEAAGIMGYTDANANPSTLVQYATADNDGGAINIVMPVRKGNYWRITAVNGSGTGGPATITWIPFGQ